MLRTLFAPLFLLLLSHDSLQAQTAAAEETKPLEKNIAYLEVGGIAHLYSLNYQRNIRLSQKVDLGAGILLSPAFYPSAIFPSRPGQERLRFSPRAALQAQAIYKMDRHEIGLGASWGYYTWYFPETFRQTYRREAQYQEIRSFAMGQLGYSYTMKNGLYLGAYYTPAIMDSGDFWFQNWGGLRIGYRF